jgi:hypothetical protein
MSSNSNSNKYIMPHGIEEIPIGAAAPSAQEGGKKKSKTKKVNNKLHKGGDLMTDLKNLAVPFAIILAKQTVEKMNVDKKTSKSPKSVEISRRKTVGGGSIQMMNNSQEVKKNFSKLAQDINLFFKKY